MFNEVMKYIACKRELIGNFLYPVVADDKRSQLIGFMNKYLF